MKSLLVSVLILGALLAGASQRAEAQRIAYIASQVIREKYPEAIQAGQRLQSMVDDWKREIDDQKKFIDDLELDIKKNRLVWSEAERAEKEALLERKRREREDYASKKFNPGGEYDKAVNTIFQGVEEKIFAATQEVALDDNYDIVWDKSTQPLVFINPKFDLTVKVMRKLGINVDDMAKQQEEAIKNDPRNKASEREKASPAQRKRSRAQQSLDENQAPKSDEPRSNRQRRSQPASDSTKPDDGDIPR